MTVTIGNTTYENISYDADADVLYLHVGEPETAVDFDESPEGHALRFNSEGKLVGVTIVNARWLLEREGKITLTTPQRVEVGADALIPALTAA